MKVHLKFMLPHTAYVYYEKDGCIVEYELSQYYPNDLYTTAYTIYQARLQFMKRISRDMAIPYDSIYIDRSDIRYVPFDDEE
jgi:hypothetical protein